VSALQDLALTWYIKHSNDHPNVGISEILNAMNREVLDTYIIVMCSYIGDDIIYIFPRGMEIHLNDDPKLYGAQF